MTATNRTSSASAPSKVDGRSVGDLLLEADLTVRELLWDAPPETAKAKARSWGEVVEAAAGLWSSFPDRTGNPSMERIHKLAISLARAEQRTGWPGAGEGDPHLDRVVDNLARATELISARRHPTAPLSEPGHLDSEAARTRIMHVVYVASHSVGQALWQYHRDMRRVLDAQQRLEAGQSADQSHDLLVRLGAAEQLAASYLEGRWPASLKGQHRDPIESARLEQALARWDVQARRTLAASTTAANVLLTVKVERDLTMTGARITAAAAKAGAVDTDQHQHRLQPALGSLDEAWAQLGGDLEQITGRVRRIDPDLIRAGAELRASLREITVDFAGHASPTTMGQRADLRAASSQVQQGWVAAIDRGYDLRDAVVDPELTAPARGVQAACTRYFGRAGEAAWVDAADVHANRPVALPEALRDLLAERCVAVVSTAVRVDSASSFLGVKHETSPVDPRLNGRANAERAAGGPPTASQSYSRAR